MMHDLFNKIQLFFATKNFATKNKMNLQLKKRVTLVLQ